MPSRKRPSSASKDPATVAATYSAILDALAAHVALLDPNGVILAVNKGWRKFGRANGLTADDAGIGCNYLKVCDAAEGPSTEDARRAAAGIRGVLAGRTAEFTFEYPCHSPVEARWFRMRASAVETSTAAGLEGGLVVTHLNVTERRLAEQGQRMQAQMLDQIGQAVIATDMQGRVIYANRSAADLYEWPVTEMHGRAISEITVPQDSHDLSDEISGPLRRGENWSGEFLVQTRRGRIFPAAVVDSPLLNDRGELVGIIGISTDITARKQMEAAVLASEREQRGLAEQLQEERARLIAAQAVAKIGSWETDLDTMLVAWSEETHRIFGTDPLSGTLSHQGFLARVHPADRARVDGAFHDLIAGKGPGTIEHRIVLPNGDIKTVEENWRVFRNDAGKPLRALGTCQDITERKKMEQQFLRAQRMESVGTLAGGIAHDLNNILAPILMASELLESEVTTDEGRELLDTLHESAHRGASLVKQVLSFARGIHTERVTVNPVSLVRDIVKVVRETFPRSVSVGMAAAPDLWTIPGDATQVHQVLMNLCLNARDAMPDGGLIGVSLDNVVLDETYAAMTPEAQPGPYVLVRVSDTGTGIPPEVRDRIFEPFFTMKEVGKGTGLGLSTTLAIVKSHGGFITLESAVGVGTTFSVYFPANVAETSGDRAPDERRSLPQGHGELILVVDDERPIRIMVQRTLESFGYRVISASNGAEAVSVYAEHDKDIAAVLTDMAMPIMDGPSMIIALRAMNPLIKVIGSSGRDSSQSIERALSGGLEHFVPKPYTAEALLTIVAKALQRKGTDIP